MPEGLLGSSRSRLTVPTRCGTRPGRRSPDRWPSARRRLRSGMPPGRPLGAYHASRRRPSPTARVVPALGLRDIHLEEDLWSPTPTASARSRRVRSDRVHPFQPGEGTTALDLVRLEVADEVPLRVRGGGRLALSLPGPGSRRTGSVHGGGVHDAGAESFVTATTRTSAGSRSAAPAASSIRRRTATHRAPMAAVERVIGHEPGNHELTPAGAHRSPGDLTSVLLANSAGAGSSGCRGRCRLRRPVARATSARP